MLFNMDTKLTCLRITQKMEILVWKVNFVRLLTAIYRMFITFNLGKNHYRIN